MERIESDQADKKVKMQEELVRKRIIQTVVREEADEKARRILEAKSEIAKADPARVKTITLLREVQEQLLDVFVRSEVQFP